MQDDVGLGKVKNMSLHDSHSMTPVDGMDLIKIIQENISSDGHLITINRCQNVHNINETICLNGKIEGKSCYNYRNPHNIYEPLLANCW